MSPKTLAVALAAAAATITSVSVAAPPAPASTPPAGAPVMTESERSALVAELVTQHGADQRARIERGLGQVLALWRAEDGDAAALASFAKEHFLSDPQALADTFAHLEYALEMIGGHANEVAREVSRFQMLDEGPLRPVDALLAAYSPKAHLSDDLFAGKTAFVVLLNWPDSTLEERVREGMAWSRQRWAEARLVGQFRHRVPAAAAQRAAQAYSAAEAYIDGYDIQMDLVALPDGSLPFRKGLRLISHWGLRDEIRGLYASPQGLAQQQTLAQIMRRIVRQEIPAQVVGGRELQWDPASNLVRKPGGAWESAPREDDLRYARILEVFRSQQALDPYFPDLPSHLRRSFELEREMSEERVRTLFETLLSSPVAQQVGQRVAQRLGRPLQPFDLWYTGFRAGSGLDEGALDEITRKRYPTLAAFEADIPRILGILGFSPETARFLGERIAVDPARGPGHAYPAELRAGRSHLRTRMAAGGLDYKGFNIAMHELGHNVEQVFSIARIDHILLGGVPNNGFTEAFAFLFQGRDLEILGVAQPDPQAEARATLARFWDAFEIAGVGLLDAALWRWMYEHPAATPAELRDATVQLAQDLWNRFYAPVFGGRDEILPAIYSHIVAFGLYTPNYPLGMLITFQVEQHMKGKSLAAEMERMCRLGRLAPDVWMQQAVGSPVSVEPLLQATERALQTLK